MGKKESDFKHQCLALLLRPVVRFCLRHGLTVQQLTESAKSLAVEFAEQEIRARSEKVTVSRLSIITGLQRRDITRMRRQQTTEPVAGSLATRVLGYWENNRAYLEKGKNQPRPLTIDQFRNLVAKVSTDVNSATVMYDLERTGAIVRGSDNVIRLQRPSYIPDDPTESFQLVEKDCEDLIRSVEDNVFQTEKPRRLHGRTEFDNISRAHLSEIGQWLRSEGTQFHQRARHYLSQFDLDINPDLEGSGGAYVALGTFGRIREKKEK